MRVIDAKDLARWESVAAGEVLEFQAGPGPRAVRLEVNASGPVAVFASDEATERTLVAYGEGLFECGFTAAGVAMVDFEHSGGVHVVFSSQARSHVVQAVDVEGLTTIAPMQGQSSEYERMVRLMKANELRREQLVADEVQRLRSAAEEYGRTLRQQEAIEKGRAKAEEVDAANEARRKPEPDQPDGEA